MNFRKEDLLGLHKDRIKIGASLADVDPMQIDQTVCVFLSFRILFVMYIQSFNKAPDLFSLTVDFTWF